MMSTRKERYTVRPFDGLDEADEVLAAVRLIVGDVAHEAGSVSVDPAALTSDDFAVVLPAPDQLVMALAKTPVSAMDCSLVVVASGRTHRVADVLLREYPVASAKHATTFSLVSSASGLSLRDAGGWDVTVAVVLEHGLNEVALQPHRPGTWLARRDFRVVPERDETSFSPQELTDDVRQLYGLPKSAPSFIAVEADTLLHADSVADAITVYLDRDILRLLQANQSDAVAQQMQAQLAVETMLVIVRSVFAELGAAGVGNVATSDLDSFPAVKRLFERLARMLKTDLHSTLGVAAKPDELAAHLKGAFGLQTLGVRSLRGAVIESAEGADE